MDCGAQQAFSRQPLTSNLGHSDLVFDILSRFISRSVHARLQVSVCSGCNLCHLADIQTRIHVQTPESLNQFWNKLYTPCERI